jgi:amino acid permease
MLFYTCGSCISYFVIIGIFAFIFCNRAGDLFVDVFAFFFPTVPLLQNRVLVIGGICVLCVFPLCMLKSLNYIMFWRVAVDSLKYVSFLSILSILVTVGVVFGKFISNPVVNSTVEIFHITSNFFRMIPVMSVSFNCHYNVPRYYYVPFSFYVDV